MDSSPDSPLKRPRVYKNYNGATIDQAIQEYIRTGDSLSAISQRFNIPRSTIADKIKQVRNKQPSTKRSSYTLLHDESELLQEQIAIQSLQGDAPSIPDVVKMVCDIRARRGKSVASAAAVKSWLSTSQSLHMLCSRAVESDKTAGSEWGLNHDYLTHFEELKREHNVDDNDIYCFGEKTIKFGPSPCYFVMASKKLLDFPLSPRNNDSATLLAISCADGWSAPLMVALKGKYEPPVWYAELDTPNTYMQVISDEKWGDDKLMNAFFDQFLGYALPRKRGEKIILICDPHHFHCTDEFMARCAKHSIIPCHIPKHSSHLNLPVAETYLAQLKSSYHKIVYKQYSPRNVPIDQEQFLGILRRCASEISRENVLDGFQYCGINPFNPQTVLDKCINKPEGHPSDTLWDTLNSSNVPPSGSWS